MPEFQTFLDPANMDTLWENVEWLLFYVAPVVMIYVAIVSIGHLIDVVKNAFSHDKKEETDDEYDIYRY